jgi:AcrR family transcriptional regulator
MNDVATRPYRQRRRAAASEANTARIMEAALELFRERPFEQITLAAVAERAGVGVQTVIRRVGTKDGLVRASYEWVVPRVLADRGAPVSADPREVATALERHYERWGDLTERTLRQEDASPAIAANAAAGRRGHRAWIAAAFADPLAALPAAHRAETLGRLIGVCGIELWSVLRRDGGLSAEQARDAVADLISSVLTPEP